MSNDKKLAGLILKKSRMLKEDDTKKAAKDTAKQIGSDKTTIKGTTEYIDTKQVKKMPPIEEFVKNSKNKSLKMPEKSDNILKKAVKSKAFQKIAKAAGKKALKSIPIVGGVASAVMSGDASAAVPILSEAEEMGAPKGSDLRRSEDPSLSAEERHKLQEKIRQSMKSKKTKK
jgi:hypothetical protein